MSTTPHLVAENNSEVDNLALRLHEQYPGDIGVFNVYLLNYIILKPGEGLYMGANEPHAYISGDCFECMATSDNVVRAGLTPKFKDVNTLCSMLTYAAGTPQLLAGVIAHSDTHGSTRVYAPPVEEFQVELITANGSGTFCRSYMNPLWHTFLIFRAYSLALLASEVLLLAIWAYFSYSGLLQIFRLRKASF